MPRARVGNGRAESDANGLTVQESYALGELWVASKERGHDYGVTTRGVPAVLVEKGYVTVRGDGPDGRTMFLFTERGRALFQKFNDSPKLEGSDVMPKVKQATMQDETEAAEPKGKAKAPKGKAGKPAPKVTPKAGKAEANGEARGRGAAGLGAAQVRVLETLSEASDPMTRAQLAEETGVKKGWSRILGANTKADGGVAGDAGLVAKGLVKMEQHEGTRSLLYTITTQGRKALQAAQKEIAARE